MRTSELSPSWQIRQTGPSLNTLQKASKVIMGVSVVSKPSFSHCRTKCAWLPTYSKFIIEQRIQSLQITSLTEGMNTFAWILKQMRTDLVIKEKIQDMSVRQNYFAKILEGNIRQEPSLTLINMPQNDKIPTCPSMKQQYQNCAFQHKIKNCM